MVTVPAPSVVDSLEQFSSVGPGAQHCLELVVFKPTTAWTVTNNASKIHDKTDTLLDATEFAYLLDTSL